MKNIFTGKTRLFLCISGAIIAVALILQVVGLGLNLGIDFTGGSILNYSVGEDYDVADVEKILNASGYTDNQITKAAPSAASIALQAELANAPAEAAHSADDGHNHTEEDPNYGIVFDGRNIDDSGMDIPHIDKLADLLLNLLHDVVIT